MKKFDLTDIQKTEKEFNFKDYIVSRDSINKDVDDFLSGRIPRGYELGIPIFDEHFVLKQKELYTLVGRKGSGKTTIEMVIQLMYAIVHDLVFVNVFQENKDWGSKLNYMNHLLGCFSSDVRKSNPNLYEKASDWIDKHFIFLKDVDIKTSLRVVEELLKSGVKVHALTLDPINSFTNGFSDTGNKYSDALPASIETLQWVNENCSVHISQHPIMSAQRESRRLTPSDAELGVWNDKSDFTWALHRDYGTNQNEINVHDVRSKFLGGSPTNSEEPLIIEWFPTKINIKKGYQIQENAIQMLFRKHNPLNLEKDSFVKEEEKLPKLDLKQAFDEKELF